MDRPPPAPPRHNGASKPGQSIGKFARTSGRWRDGNRPARIIPGEL